MRRVSPLLYAGFAAVAIAGVSAAVLPIGPVYDVYAWSIWGSELAGLDLDTSAGPSWKPLPVLICAALSPLTDALPAAWVILARAGYVAMVALSALLALELMPADAGRLRRICAAGLAALGSLLFADSITPLLRQFHGGLSEGLVAALLLAGALCHARRRYRPALLLCWLAGLLRPEALVLLAAYGLWLWVRERQGAALALALLAGGAMVWLIPELVGSGGALGGTDRARVGAGFQPEIGAKALYRGLGIPLWAIWVGVIWAVVSARRRATILPIELAVAGAGWMALVTGLVIAGYAPLPRFMLPGVSLLAVVGAVGLAEIGSILAGRLQTRHESGRAARQPPPWSSRPTAALAVAGLLGAVALQAGIRAASFPGYLRVAEDRADALSGAGRLVEEVGERRLLRCGGIEVGAELARTALAWELGSRIATVTPLLGERDETPAGVVAVGPGTPRDSIDQLAASGRELGAAGGWAAYGYRCPGAEASRRRLRVP